MSASSVEFELLPRPADMCNAKNIPDSHCRLHVMHQCLGTWSEQPDTSCFLLTGQLAFRLILFVSLLDERSSAGSQSQVQAELMLCCRLDMAAFLTMPEA